MVTEITHSSRRYRLDGFIQGVWNPEDMVALPGTSWIVASGMRSTRHPGRLFAVNTASQTEMRELLWEPAAETGRRGRDVFAPHGLASRALADGRWELLVVDHGGGEAIDRLIVAIGEDGPAIIHGERIPQPPGTWADAVSYLPDDGFVATSMYDPTDPGSYAKLARAERTGQVWRWSRSGGWSRFGDLQFSGPNGLAITPDGASVIVCEWGARKVWRLDRNGAPIASRDLNFLPDNLRWSTDGRLLLAGQAVPAETVLDWSDGTRQSPPAFDVVQLDPASLDVLPLISADAAGAAQMKFGGATGALMVGDSIWVGSFTGERIAVFAPA